MRKILLVTTCFAVVLSGMIACKKADYNDAASTSPYNEAKQYLLQKASGADAHQAKKLRQLADDLDENSAVSVTGKNGKKSILCNLRRYRLSDKKGFAALYYTMKFQIGDAGINAAFIHTVRTDYSPEQYAAARTAIISMEDHGFTGEVVTNALNDKFLLTMQFQHGNCTGFMDLQAGSKNSRLTKQTDANNCIAYYLVTTTIFSDGSVQRKWSYLYTLCGACIPTGEPVTYLVPDCEGEAGGGGSSNYADTTNPCALANTLAADATYKSRLDSLKQLVNQNYESGFYSIKGPDGITRYTFQQGAPGQAAINGTVPFGINSYTHNHYQGLLSVFSPQDMRQMYQWFKEGAMADAGSFTMTLVTASGTTYMMQIDNIAAFQQFGNTWLQSDITFSFFETHFLNRFHIFANNSNLNNRNGFLQMLSEYSTGIKFFEGNVNGFSEWRPKRYEPDDMNGGNIIDSPCN